MAKIRPSPIPWSWFSICLISLLVFPGVGYTMTVMLAWEPSPTPGVSGYKLYYTDGTSGPPYEGTGAYEGESPIDVGDVRSFSVSGLDSTRTHFFVATAYLPNGLESEYSNEVSTSDSPTTPDSPATPASAGGGGGSGGGCFIDTAKNAAPTNGGVTGFALRSTKAADYWGLTAQLTRGKKAP